MKRVCAWCGQKLDQVERREQHQVTHGLCRACRRKFFTSAKMKGANPGSTQEDVGDSPGEAGGHVPTE
jgi:hypothetical protein